MGLKYYADMKYAHLSDLLRQDNTINKKQLMAFSDYSWQVFSDTGISKREYIIFYQCGPIGHGTHFPVPFSQSSA